MDDDTIGELIELLRDDTVDESVEFSPEYMAKTTVESVESYLKEYDIDEGDIGILVDLAPSTGPLDGLSIQYSLRYTENTDSDFPPNQEYESFNETKTNRETMDEVYPTVVETLQEEFPEAQIQYNPVHET